jgi:hypothetical protein
LARRLDVRYVYRREEGRGGMRRGGEGFVRWPAGWLLGVVG